MTMISMKVLIDTNIFVNAFIAEAAQHAAARKKLRELRDSAADLWISPQIVREFISACTRLALINGRPTRAEVLSYVGALIKDCSFAVEDENVSRELMLLAERHPVSGKQIHDLNLVATMSVYGLDVLLTDNLDDLRRYEREVKVLSLT